MKRHPHWTNKSVLAFAGEDDPLGAVVRHVREIVLNAIDEGWEGPPFDPFELAERLEIPVVASEDLEDARTVPAGTGVQIEFNPNRPWGRLRFSVAHEIAHTIFPDCAEFVRHRATKKDSPGDAWQLELLCNIAAAEILMPIGTLPDLESAELDIDALLALRKNYDVSLEAVLLRVARLTKRPSAVFAASRVDGNSLESRFRVDYVVDSPTWSSGVKPGLRLPRSSLLGECNAVGFTAKGTERWGTRSLELECVGSPPYPGQRLPRVLGIAQPPGHRATQPVRSLFFLSGDATCPRGNSPAVVIHVVNETTPNWGGPFAKALSRRWPVAQSEFRSWVGHDRHNLSLGGTHFSRVDDRIVVGTMIAQRGYGKSKRRRLNYSTLIRCLATVADYALSHGNMSVHMPRIGAGQAGGDWAIIEEMIENTLIRQGLDVTVYTLPGAEFPNRLRSELPFNA